MAVQNGFAAEGSGIKKRPAAALAIEDGAVEVPDNISEDLLNVKKKPAAKASALTETALKARNDEIDKQNDQLNKCLEAAVVQMQKQEMAAKKGIVDSNNAEVVSTKKRLKEIHEEELQP